VAIYFWSHRGAEALRPLQRASKANSLTSISVFSASGMKKLVNFNRKMQVYRAIILRFI
jgi:hypothetical protein